MNIEEKTLKHNPIYKGKILTLCVDEAELPDGKTAIREVVEHNGGVGIIALTDSDEIFLVKQFRYPYKEIIFEIPAGKREMGEDPLTCGIRELREETGMTAKQFTPLGKVYPSPGYCGEIIWLFLATGLESGSMDLDDDEYLEVEKVPFKKALRMVLDGTISDSKTQIAILKLDAIKRGLL